MEYYDWLIILILIVAVILCFFALWSEFKAYARIKRIIPAWEIDDPEAKIKQLEGIACMGGMWTNTWRVSLIAAVISTALIWAVLAPYLTPLMVLGIGATIFIIGYFFSAFMIAHWYRPLCFKAKDGALSDHEVQAQGKGVHKVGDDPLNLPSGYKQDTSIYPSDFTVQEPLSIPLPVDFGVCIPSVSMAAVL